MTQHDLSGEDDALDALVRDELVALRRPVTPRPAAISALKSAIRADAASAAAPMARIERQSRARWFTTPHALRASPLALLAAASLLIVCTSAITVTVTGRAASDGVALAPARPESARAGEAVRFTLAAPSARRVSLVGDFNGWDPTATTLQQRDGMWTVVIPVTPGRHQYGFVVDGTQWIADPAAAQSADSDFGTRNSVMYVGG